ncbi:sugar O-acyltransferase, sialic acid O-acetyltransferase NeuD family [Halopelagius inordinatus]|uniref:Sugar O-acyltransferase, sialic acid O-acetyltransferase NeuD family n=1 Tax=Halopelagius inordinatus TaxID=553467 RepID=A0A1I2PNU0_9EURY|nr:acetyltransferase [Halopelagius inordinatus]SFG17250.1 sugar O-acyltransferase, sialic acid O-acetyltransferase NeuD family [Halopelagius inordinatus]
MKIIIVGAGGHSRVVYDILRADRNVAVSAFVDNSPRGSEETIMGVPVIGDHDVLPEYVKKNDVAGFIVAVGDNDIRQQHFETMTDMGLEPVSAIHPDATISETANIGPGTVIASGSIITTNAKVGENAIVNTGSVIEHESEVGDHAHVGPGTTVAGRVRIGDGTFVGMGSSVTDYTTIGENSTIGAGSVVLDDVESDTVVAGAPAELKRRKEQQ